MTTVPLAAPRLARALIAAEAIRNLVPAPDHPYGVESDGDLPPFVELPEASDWFLGFVMRDLEYRLHIAYRSGTLAAQHRPTVDRIGAAGRANVFDGEAAVPLLEEALAALRG